MFSEILFKIPVCITNFTSRQFTDQFQLHIITHSESVGSNQELNGVITLLLGVTIRGWVARKETEEHSRRTKLRIQSCLSSAGFYHFYFNYSPILKARKTTHHLD